MIFDIVALYLIIVEYVFDKNLDKALIIVSNF